jgi:uncharacterized membrane protein
MILREHGYLLFIVLSAVFFAVAFFKRNRVVGYRTPYTVSDQSAWKSANITFGICTLISGLILVFVYKSHFFSLREIIPIVLLLIGLSVLITEIRLRYRNRK